MNITIIDNDPSPKVSAIIVRIKSFDWYYMMSDDHRIWRKGEDEKNLIIKLIFELSLSELAELSGLWGNLRLVKMNWSFDEWVNLAIERAKERLLSVKASTK